MADLPFSSEGTDMQGVAEAAAVAYEPISEQEVVERDRLARLRWIKDIAQSGPVHERKPSGRRTPEEIEATLKEIRELLAQKVPPGVSLVDELIADRRAEHRREYPELHG
jgi:hypothetical protein